MKKILALALTLVMLVSLLPVLGVSAVEVEFDMSDATFNIESLDDTKVKFVVDGNTATLNGSMIPKQTNHAALNYTGIFTSEINVDEFVTQTIKIDTMPVFDDPFYQYLHYASGYFNVLSRNYGTATVESLPEGKAKKDCHDMLMYSIYRKDEEGNLGLQIYNMTIGNYTIIPVPDFAEKIGEAFTLTTIWHDDNTVTFLCDDVSIGTFDNVTFAHARSVDRKQYLSIGYNAAGTANSGSNPVKLTVSDIKISHGHTPDSDDGDCTTALYCVDCGEEIIPAMPAHTPAKDDGNCTTAVPCVNTGCTKNVVDAKPHTPAEDDGDCTTAVKCTTCEGNAVEANPDHKPALRNPKYPTDKEAGYTGDIVCYQCPYVFSEGEEIPKLEKSSFGTNQSIFNASIYVYIAIGAAVLVAAAVVVILVVRKKQNRKAPKDSV